jgi:GT2 family glycosyltransferase
MSSVAAIIPSWNTARYIQRCVESLAAQERIDIETLVVDNGSHDSSIQLLARLRVPHLALSRNVGFAGAVNLGVARTSAPFVLVLNADCFLAPRCVCSLLAAMNADDRLGGVQPRIVQDSADQEVARVYSAGQCLSRYGAAFERGWGELDGPQFDEDGEVFGVSGAACLLRREMFTNVGGYDESYFAFFEDVDLNARARLAGWKFAYISQALAVHVGHAGWRQLERSHSFNVELTVRNRLATAVRVLPRRGVAGAAAATLRSLVASPFRGTSTAVLRGTLTALRWLPRLLAERKRLRSDSSLLLDQWLTRTSGPGPNPGHMTSSVRP